LEQTTSYVENTTELVCLEQSILENIPEIVVQYDSEMRTIWANRAACEAGKSTLEDMRGLKCREFLCLQMQDCFLCPVELAIETGQPQQVKTYDLDGNFRLVRCYPILNSNDEVASVLMFALKIEMDSSLLQDSEIRNFHNRFSHLSPREKQVMRLVAEGKANKVIATELEISPKTVEIHRARVMEKLQVDSVAKLVRYLSNTEAILRPNNSHLFCV
jgi:DNA-binding CsgD family transcriptional regulator